MIAECSVSYRTGSVEIIPIVETAYSMIKKVFGASLRARKAHTRETEAYMRVIAHNVRVTMEQDLQWMMAA